MILGETTAPPAQPAEGEGWVIAAPATGEWSGHAGGEIATYAGGVWHFIDPHEGMRALDRSREQFVIFTNGSWIAGMAPPTFGDTGTVDSEARQAILAILSVLQNYRMLPSS